MKLEDPYKGVGYTYSFIKSTGPFVYKQGLYTLPPFSNASGRTLSIYPILPQTLKEPIEHMVE